MNPYKILNVPKSATLTQIKAAYRKLSKQHHPDLGGDPAIFKQISDAYEILSNQDRRQRFDETGSTDSESDQQHFEKIVIGLAIEGFTRSDTPIAAILDKLDNDMDGLESKLEESERMRNKLNQRLEKFLKRNEPCLISEVIEGKIAQTERQEEELKKGLDLIVRIQKFFKEFKEDRPTPTRVRSDSFHDLLTSINKASLK